MAQIVRYREGSVTVTVDDELAALVERLLEETAPGVRDRIESEVEAVYRAAVSAWPVKTGRSRDGLRTAITLDRSQGRIEGAVLALVGYSVYIKPRKLRKGTAWQTYVRGPMTDLKRRLLAELGDVIVNGRKARGGRGGR